MYVRAKSFCDAGSPKTFFIPESGKHRNVRIVSTLPVLNSTSVAFPIDAVFPSTPSRQALVKFLLRGWLELDNLY